MFKSYDLKKFIFRTSLWIFTIINTTVFLVTRNSFWISYPGQAWHAAQRTRDRTYLASEFERHLSCYDPLGCLRSSGSFLSQALIEVTTFTSEATRINLTIDQKTFIILIGGMAWRLLCLGIFVAAIAKLFHSFKVGLLLGNGLVFLLSGLPLWQLGRLLTNLPLNLSPSFIDRANEAFVHMSFSDLIFYDYGFFALVPMIALALSKIKSLSLISSRGFFLIGFITASFYEAFVPIVFLSLTVFYLLDKKWPLIKSVWLLLGQFAWTITRIFTLRFTEAADPQSQFFIGSSFLDFFSWYQRKTKGLSTTSSLPSIAVQLILISTLTVTVGFLMGLVVNSSQSFKLIDQRSLRSISAVTSAVSIVIVGSFFRPIYVETGRQSLGLSIALMLFSFSCAQNLMSDGKMKFGVKK